MRTCICRPSTSCSRRHLKTFTEAWTSSQVPESCTLTSRASGLTTVRSDWLQYAAHALMAAANPPVWQSHAQAILTRDSGVYRVCGTRSAGVCTLQGGAGPLHHAGAVLPDQALWHVAGRRSAVCARKAAPSPPCAGALCLQLPCAACGIDPAAFGALAGGQLRQVNYLCNRPYAAQLLQGQWRSIEDFLLDCGAPSGANCCRQDCTGPPLPLSLLLPSTSDIVTAARSFSSPRTSAATIDTGDRSFPLDRSGPLLRFDKCTSARL